ncbi:homoserine O-acetyltransferase MetX [Baaleninema simplex]|uniref:homoserine O-acetyltransferase MetX n=1 Tax=Baaleninema simplex TaxID=2862350 RepID=UPI000349089F|nr:homoserine O-acetyltransferase [Baaleninema simplex]
MPLSSQAVDRLEFSAIPHRQFSMKYSHLISPDTQFHQLTEPFAIESGDVMVGVKVAYRTWGRLNANGDNAIHICHALTGSADADEWWGPLFGLGRAFDPDRDFIVCSNVLGSCYGTTGPISMNPATGKPYGPDFPSITVRDMVRLQARLMKELGVQKLHMAIGGSLGGMQVLEWGKLYPDFVESIVSVAASGRHSAWCIGISEAQRQAIRSDPNWRGGWYDDDALPKQGLAAARMMAMISYRAYESFEKRFGRKVQENGDRAVCSYLRYQGQKLVDRFDANTYLALIDAMDSHDVAEGRGDYYDVLRSIDRPALVVTIDSDLLYPPVEQQELARFMPNAKLEWLYSPHGHDAFLIDMEALNRSIVEFRRAVFS